MSARTWIVAGALFAALAVCTGAFGAHAFKDRLAESNKTETYEIAVRYQMYHALALVLLGLLALNHTSGWTSVAGSCFIAGIAIFSGLLYINALGGPKWLGAIVPLGGLAFIVGWLAMAATAMAMAKVWPVPHD